MRELEDQLSSIGVVGEEDISTEMDGLEENVRESINCPSNDKEGYTIYIRDGSWTIALTTSH